MSPLDLSALTIEDVFEMIEDQERSIAFIRGITMKRVDDHRITPTQAAKKIAHVERVLALLLAIKEEFPQ